MVNSLVTHLGQSCEILNIRDTGVAIEFDLIIGEALLDSRQELVIVPYERLNDLKYWQQVTRIVVNNHRASSGTKPSSRRRPRSKN